jgi:hypothetical protein
MSSDDKLLDLNDHALEGLGGYIGPSTSEEIVEAIVNHSSGAVIAQMATSGGEVLWRHVGWPVVYDGWMNAGDEDYDGDDEGAATSSSSTVETPSMSGARRSVAGFACSPTSPSFSSCHASAPRDWRSIATRTGSACGCMAARWC